jgi:hypothetical protein
MDASQWLPQLSELPPALATGVVWTCRLAAFSTLLQSLELLLAREEGWGDLGVWRLDTLKVEKIPFGFLLTESRFTGILVLNSACASLLLLEPALPLWGVPALTTLLVAWRFRGTFNGGSDGMTFLTLSSLAVASLGGFNQTVSRVSLTFIAAQAVVSYVAAGWAKARHHRWWSGRALRGYVLLSGYQVPKNLRRILARRAVAKVCAWGVVGFELAFPLVLFTPRLTPLFLAAGAAFHLLNFAVFGLNRFFWAWIATYPAILTVAVGR